MSEVQATSEDVSLVTGGGSGIGQALCVSLGARGDAVVVVDLDFDAAQRVADQMNDSGRRAMAVAADVTQPDDIGVAFDAAEKSFGPVTNLYNNAGVPAALPLEQITPEIFRRVMDINVLGVINGTQDLARRVRARNGAASIVNSCSVAGKRGFPSGSLYSASKFAVRGLTQSHAQELADDGIRVNAICPGIVATPLWREVANQRGQSADPSLSDYHDSIALGRHATPDDIVGTALFLTSPAASYITGQCINVDGGMAVD